MEFLKDFIENPNFRKRNNVKILYKNKVQIYTFKRDALYKAIKNT